MAENRKDFKPVLTAIWFEEPDRVPMAEVWADQDATDASVGNRAHFLDGDIELWHRAGHDFDALDGDIYAVPQIQRAITGPLKNPAHSYAEQRMERRWVASGSMAFRSQQDIDEFVVRSAGVCFPFDLISASETLVTVVYGHHLALIPDHRSADLQEWCNMLSLDCLRLPFSHGGELAGPD